MGRNRPGVPVAKGLNDVDRATLEELDDDVQPTLAQRIVGRVVGTLYLRYGDDGADGKLLARQVAVSLGYDRGGPKMIELRGQHFIRMTVATGYAEWHGQTLVLTDAGRSLAERATAKARDAAGLPPLDDSLPEADTPIPAPN